MNAVVTECLRTIPSVSELLRSPACQHVCCDFGEGITKSVLREVLGDARSDLLCGQTASPPDRETLIAALRGRLLRLTQPVGRKAINATGILLHTGLGRAPLCDEAIEAVEGCRGYSVLQTDPVSGQRSKREEKVERLLVELTGCEAATLANNNAAATMLILNTLAEGREVIISRGQLVEIGGSFRMPDVLDKSSVILREVGTTNRTHLRDYERAIGDNIGAIIRVHASNYLIRGFACTPTIEELCQLGRDYGIPVIDDVGSGALVPLEQFGLPNEPLVSASIKAGVSAVCFSGDKLISGPQCGIICGKHEIIERIRKNPFARMLRVCKMTLAALEATLVHFVNGSRYRTAIPFYRMLTRTVDELERQARRLVDLTEDLPVLSVSIVDEMSYVGSGSVPDQGIKTKAVAVVPRDRCSSAVSPGELGRRLRTSVPSVFCRVKDGAVLLDMRTLWMDDVEEVAQVLHQVFDSEG